jgi:hypothetical protein
MHRDDPAAMTIHERLDEVASLLAAGFLRLKRRTGCLPPDAFSLKPLPHGHGSVRKPLPHGHGSVRKPLPHRRGDCAG